MMYTRDILVLTLATVLIAAGAVLLIAFAMPLGALLVALGVIAAIMDGLVELLVAGNKVPHR